MGYLYNIHGPVPHGYNTHRHTGTESPSHNSSLCSSQFPHLTPPSATIFISSLYQMNKESHTPSMQQGNSIKLMMLNSQYILSRWINSMSFKGLLHSMEMVSTKGNLLLFPDDSWEHESRLFTYRR